MQWLGDGSLIGKSGKTYKRGEDIPTGEVNPERIKQLKKKGKIGIIPKAVPAVDPEVEKLKAEIEELKKANESLVKINEELQAKVKANSKPSETKKGGK